MSQRNGPRPYRLMPYRAADGWRYRIMSGNGQIVAASEEAFRSRWYMLRKARRLYRDVVLIVDRSGG